MIKYIRLVVVVMVAALFFFNLPIPKAPERVSLLPSEESMPVVTSTPVDPVRGVASNGVEGPEGKEKIAEKEPEPHSPKQVKKIIPPAPRFELPPVLLPLPKPEPPPIISAATGTPLIELPPPFLTSLPPLDEDAILRAVVKIQCPTKDGLGKFIGSGFVLKGDLVVSAAHVIMDSGSETCEIIFPRERRPTYYLRGTIDGLKEVKRRHDEEGIDVGILKLPKLETYPEAAAIFSAYPAIPYSICENPKMLGDKLVHLGYPSNYVDQNYLSRLEGEAVVWADIQGVKEQLSEDQTYTFRTPIFGFTADESEPHPYMVSRVSSFYGDSGGLAFNVTRQCILGPHRGGTIGKGEGENYSIFMVLGWKKIKNLTQQ